MQSPWRIFAGLLLWAVVLYGVLHVHLLGAEWSHVNHSLCGPWGCYPPTSALVAWHGFWLVLLVGPAFVVGVLGSRRVFFYVALAATAGSLIGLGVVALWQLTQPFDPFVVPLLHTLLYRLVDVPLLPLLLVGTAMLTIAPWRRPRPDIASPPPPGTNAAESA